MLKRVLFLLLAISVLSFTVIKIYKDGRYKGSSRSIYTQEPYYGHADITIKDGKISAVKFTIRDSVKHEYFDAAYEKYFVGNDEYVQQCRKDWNGVQTYPEKLIKCQDIDQLDAVSGATWSYNIFKASVKEALKNSVAEK